MLFKKNKSENRTHARYTRIHTKTDTCSNYSKARRVGAFLAVISILVIQMIRTRIQNIELGIYTNTRETSRGHGESEKREVNWFEGLLGSVLLPVSSTWRGESRGDQCWEHWVIYEVAPRRTHKDLLRSRLLRRTSLVFSPTSQPFSACKCRRLVYVNT